MTLLIKNNDGTFTQIAGKIMLVDSLDSDDSTKALSAKQGKVLNLKISGLTMAIYNLLYPVGYIHVGFQTPGIPDGSEVVWTLLDNYDGRYIKLFSTIDTGSKGGSLSHTHSLSKNGGACIGWTWTAQESNMLLGITGDASDCQVSFTSSSKQPCNGYQNYNRSIPCVPLRGNTDSTTIDPSYVTLKAWKRTK